MRLSNCFNGRYRYLQIMKISHMSSLQSFDHALAPEEARGSFTGGLDALVLMQSIIPLLH